MLISSTRLSFRQSRCPDRITANHVVVATGPYHHPNVPEFAPELAPSITHILSSGYQNPDQLPEGDVLVVGAGNSGAEISIELAILPRWELSESKPKKGL